MTAQRMSDYTAAAKAAIADYVERSTRFVPDDVRYADAKYLEASYRVDVVHQLSCRLDETTKIGRSKPGADDLEAYSGDEYGMLSKSLRTEAYGTLSVVRNLAQRVTNAVYGRYDDESSFGSYSRSVYHTYTCSTCTGSGHVTCNSCHGRGHQTCGFCGGMGSTTETHWETDHRGHSTSTTRSETCTWCMGSGHTTCSECSGSGEVTCGTCDGHGKLTDIATPGYRVYSTYALAPMSLSDADVEYALTVRMQLQEAVEQELATILRRDIETDEEARRVVERVELASPFFKARVAVGSAAAQMVLFGVSCRVSDAGGLIENLVRPDLEKLEEAVIGLRWFDVPALRYAQAIGRLFMESEVHQMAIEQAPAVGTTPEHYSQLADSLAKALSPTYLMHAVTGMEKLARQTKAETERVLVLVGAPLCIGTGAYFWQAESPVFATIAALGIAMLAKGLSSLLVKRQLRKTGEERLVQFVAKRQR